jgi:hypothetical protein
MGSRRSTSPLRGCAIAAGTAWSSERYRNIGPPKEQQMSDAITA